MARRWHAVGVPTGAEVSKDPLVGSQDIDDSWVSDISKVQG